jgi:hypothetical protein
MPRFRSSRYHKTEHDVPVFIAHNYVILSVNKTWNLHPRMLRLATISCVAASKPFGFGLKLIFQWGFPITAEAAATSS